MLRTRGCAAHRGTRLFLLGFAQTQNSLREFSSASFRSKRCTSTSTPRFRSNQRAGCRQSRGVSTSRLTAKPERYIESWLVAFFRNRLVGAGGGVLLVVACAAPPRGAPPPPVLPPALASSSTATASECAADGDCRAASDYCGGCTCRPLLRDAASPKCSGRAVACFVDPCRGKRSVCRKGVCELADETDR